METQLPHGKGHTIPSPLFGPCLLWPNGWMDQDTTWHGGCPRPRRQCVRWGPSSPTERVTATPPLFAHVPCGQTAGWIKIPFGTEVGPGPVDTVLDGHPAPPRKGALHFLAHVYCGQTVDGSRSLGTDVGLGPGDIVLDGDPAPPSKIGAQQPPLT